jgi:hypothetical protein
VAPFLPFIKLEDGSLDDETTRNMGDAFNATVKVLRSTAQPAVVYASIAARIIEAAGRGECDTMRLQQVEPIDNGDGAIVGAELGQLGTKPTSGKSVHCDANGPEPTLCHPQLMHCQKSL